MTSHIPKKARLGSVFTFLRKAPVFVFLPVFLLCLALGCGKSIPTVTTLSGAHQKFLRVCEEDAQLTPIIKPLENTLYVYLPIEHEIMTTKPNGKEAFQSPLSKSAKALLFLDGEFKENRFSFTYDVSGQKSYPNELGYGYVYNEEYQKKESALLQALLRAYGDLDQVHLPGEAEFESHAKTLPHEEVVRFKGKKLSPDFIVLVIADIKNGMAVTKTFYLADYKLAALGTLPSEEFVRRQLFEVSGCTDATGDTQGKHIEYKEITWPDFLTRQIIHRVKFQYQRSDFPPRGDPLDAILLMAHDALKAYTFEDFDSVELINLADGKTYLFPDFRTLLKL